MIYFDNAATGGFKPSAVLDDALTVIKYLSANPGRSGHRLSITGAERIYRTRKALAQMFSGTPERVVFTKNCTEALNQAIFGTLKVGGHIITTIYEHNSVLRPLFYLKEKGLIRLDVVAPVRGECISETIKKAIKPDTYLIVTTAVSNVTGERLPFEKIGKIALERGVFYLVDGAQAGGHLPIDLKKDKINMLALAGHKGLYGIMGSGALVFDENVEINPLIFGGTGNMSHSLSQPEGYPERLESGTLNLPAISALCEGVNLVKNNLDSFAKHLYTYTERVINSIKMIKGITCYSTPNPCGIVAFSVDGYSSEEVADIFNREYDVALRGGLQCAPKIHEYLGTIDGGLVRISFAVQNTTREIDYFIKCLRNLVEG